MSYSLYTRDNFLLSTRDKSDFVGADVSKFIISDRDDGDPALTFRSIVLGTVFTALSSVITILYVFKPYQVQVSAVFLQRMWPLPCIDSR